MRFFTNKGVIQKTVIAILIVIITTFCVPSVVQADPGGKLMSPIINFVAAIFDGIQHLLEMAMLGDYSNFMKTINSGTYEERALSGVEITTDEFMDATFFGLNAVNVPVIRYTPEAIFSNQVPALDVNFIKPSVEGNDEKNIAKQLRPIIANWYVALRSIAIVGLLSVLVYLGIRMMLTSIATDRAKYKQMLVDWVIAMCLVFVLHYIMSFALTMVETVTAMISSEADGTFTVYATEVQELGFSTTSISFAANLMSYVRFMIQAGDLQIKIAYFALYVMLVIFSIRFTWVYCKRVVNMAFLTLIAPMVALTYPIDKVSDGKAQAFNMWLKEFSYNALIQPIHLLLYKVLLGSAIDLAVDNAVYAIVALGFIIAAEKLVKQMFGFGKASGGTLGSLAGAAGVTTIANKALQGFGKKGPGPQGKIRTKDNLERQGKDADANKPFTAFKGKDANDVMGAGNDTSIPEPGENGSREEGTIPPPSGEEAMIPPPIGLNEEEKAEYDRLQDDMNAMDDEYISGQDQDKIDRYNELAQKQRQAQMEEQIKKEQEAAEEEAKKEAQRQEKLNSWQDNPFYRPDDAKKEQNVLDMMKNDWENRPRFADGPGKYIGRSQEKQDNRERLKRNLKNKIGDGARRAAIGAYKAAPGVLKNASRGVLKGGAKAMGAVALGTLGGIIGATTGDSETSVSMALGAATIGGATGGNVFEATAGQRIKETNIRDTFSAGIHGNTIDARNARADKQYFQGGKFDEFYEKYYQGKTDSFNKSYSKKQIHEAVQSYRKAGITKESDIRRAMKLEETYRKRDSLSQEDARKQVQNIVQSYGEMNISERAFSGNKEAKDATLERIAGMLGDSKSANNQQMAKQIFQGYVDWRDSAV